jgi:hypothetical protein
VVDYFAQHPEVDAVVGDTVVVDECARYLCSRLGLVPGRWGTWVRFPVVTSSFFFRKKIWDSGKLRFDTRWKIFGDLFFVLEMVKQGVRFGVVPRYVSAFFDHGANLYLRADPQEVRQRQQAAPWGVRIFYFPLFGLYWLRILARGGIRPAKLSYAVYPSGQAARQTFQVDAPSYFWAGRSRWRAQE